MCTRDQSEKWRCRGCCKFETSVCVPLCGSKTKSSILNCENMQMANGKWHVTEQKREHRDTYTYVCTSPREVWKAQLLFTHTHTQQHMFIYMLTYIHM